MQSRILPTLLDLLKCIGIALISSLALELIFACLLKVFTLPSSCIMPVNQVIKVICIFLGCFFGVKGEYALLKCALGGMLAVTMMRFVFSFLAGGISWTIWIALEVLFGLIVGILCGFIVRTIKR